MFDRIPRHDLRCENTDIADFEQGVLEDWIPGSLRFDGSARFCTPRDASASRAAFDMGTNSFVIEMVVAPEAEGVHDVGELEYQPD